jgi:hypothetical protein
LTGICQASKKEKEKQPEGAAKKDKQPEGAPAMVPGQKDTGRQLAQYTLKL